MSTDWGFYCAEHDEAHTFENAREEAVKGLWASREVILAFAPLSSLPWAWQFDLPDLRYSMVEVLRRHHDCTVRLCNEYGAHGEVLGDEAPKCPITYLYDCQLPVGHGRWHHHANDKLSIRWRE